MARRERLRRDLVGLAGADSEIVQSIGGMHKTPEAGLFDASSRLCEAIGKAASRGVDPTPLVERLLDHDSPDVRKAVLQAVPQIEGVACAGKITTLLADSDPLIRRRVLCALSAESARREDGAPSWLDAAAALVEDPDPKVRGELACCLGRLGPGAPASPLERLLSDKDPFVRREAMMGLVNVLGSGSLPAAVKSLDDSSPIVVLQAISVVKKWGGRSHVGSLAPLLSRKNVHVEIAAAAALSRLGEADDIVGRHIVPYLVQPVHQGVALDALREVAGEEARGWPQGFPGIETAKHWWKDRERRAKAPR